MYYVTWDNSAVWTEWPPAAGSLVPCKCWRNADVRIEHGLILKTTIWLRFLFCEWCQQLSVLTYKWVGKINRNALFANIILAGEESTLGKRKRAVFILLTNYMYTVQFLYIIVVTLLSNSITQLCQLFGRKFRCNRLSKGNTFTKNQYETGSRS
jgi:hypothetical protein